MSDWFPPPYWVGAGPDFSAVNNAVAQNQANIIPNMNANMAYVGAQNQAALNNAYGPMGFGGQTAMYAGLGASYGRATGGFGGYTPATPAATTYPEFGYGGGGGGGDGGGMVMGNDGQFHYNAPRQYGWDANEGAPVPAQPAPFQRGMFNPQTYGWDHNEGAPAPAQPSFNDIWSGRGAQGLARDNLFNSYTWPTPQPQLDFIDRGGFGMNLGGYGAAQMSPWERSQMALAGGGGYDMGAQSRTVQNPINRVDWGQSYMPNSTGGAMGQALLASQYRPFNTGGGYNPWATNNTSLPAYSNMFGSPGSGYLGSQGRLNQDPFGGYVNPRDLDAGGSFPGNYQPGYINGIRFSTEGGA